MSKLNKTHAETIAKKLGATMKEGRGHTLAILYVDNIRIGQFGISRGPKKDQGHDHIPSQIFYPSGECLKLAQCTLNRPDWIKALRAKGKIPTPAPTPSPASRKPPSRKK